jgi:hypothetical protein
MPEYLTPGVYTEDKDRLTELLKMVVKLPEKSQG